MDIKHRQETGRKEIAGRKQAKEESQTEDKSRRNTGNGARADRRKTEIEKEPFAKENQKRQRLEGEHSETERRERRERT